MAKATTATAPKTGNRKPPKQKQELIDTGAESRILGAPIPGSDEPIVDPLEIINRATGGGHAPIDDDSINSQYGNEILDEKTGLPVEEEEDFFQGASKGVKQIPLDTLDEIARASVPAIRKVVIRKINRTNFRLGLEKQKERFAMFPGTAHTFACDKIGDEFHTGFDLKDDSGNLIYADKRVELEKKLRQDLGPKSQFWATLSLRLEDKQHGMILNFDDQAMGAHNEAVYFALMGSSMIANGLQEYATGVKPAAEWYIENKEAEAELRQKEISTEQRAFLAFGNASNAKRRGIGKLAGLAVWGSSDSVVDSLLWDYLKGINRTGDAPGNPTKNCENFLKLYEQNEIEFQTRVVVRDAIKMNVIRPNRLKELTFGDVNLGNNEDSAVSRLVLPQNAGVLRAIKSSVQAKA